MTWQFPQPGARVAVFKDDGASGETLGYYGEYVGIPFGTSTTARGNPERVRVYVPHFGRALDVDLLNVFFCPQPREVEASVAPRVPQLGAVRFVDQPLVENEHIDGFFRVSEREPWSHFRFVKTTRASIGYEFSASVNDEGLGEGILFVEVPRETSLDRNYVLKSLDEILGGNRGWEVKDGR